MRRRLESMLSDPKGWPQESAPLRVRARVMSNLASQRQEHDSRRVTVYRERRWSRRHRLQFSLRPPLAAAAVIAMIVSAAVHFMGGVEAWQPWADGMANRFYDVDGNQPNFNALANNETNRPSNDIGRNEAEALISDVLRFKAHMTGRIPMNGPDVDADAPDQSTPQEAPPARRPSNDPAPASS